MRINKRIAYNTFLIAQGDAPKGESSQGKSSGGDKKQGDKNAQSKSAEDKNKLKDWLKIRLKLNDLQVINY